MSKKALPKPKTAAAGGTVTSLAGWGKIYNYNLGVGWRHGAAKGSLVEPKPLGMLTKNAQQVGMGYGCGVGVFADGHAQVWGLNNGQQIPWSIGPEGYWTGVWDYRTNLIPQEELEEEHFTRPEIEAKEKALEFPARTVDGMKGLPGQVVYATGHVATYEGKSYEAQRENCGERPDLSPSVWKLTSPQVVQFLKSAKTEPPTEVWYPYAYNLAAPFRSTQLKNVSSLSMVGDHGVAVLKNGEIREWGRIVGRGIGGNGFNSTYGPKPRPLRPPPSKTNQFHGRITKESPWIDGLNGIRERHTKAVGTQKTSYGQATRVGSTIILPEGVTGVLPPEPILAESETELTVEKTEETAHLTEALSTTANITNLKVSALTKEVKAGEAVLLEGAGHTQSFVVTAKENVGNVNLAVESQRPFYEFPATTTKVFKSTIPSPERRRVNRIKMGSLNGVLRTTVTKTGTTTKIVLKEVTQEMKKGGKFTLVNNGKTQTWTVEQAVVLPSHEEQTITVAGQKASFEFPAKATKAFIDGTALKNYGSTGVEEGSIIKIKKPAREQSFQPVLEPTLNSAGWPVLPKLPEGVKATAVATSTKGGGYAFSLALTEEGKVLAWGSNVNGQLGQGEGIGGETFTPSPIYVKDTTSSGPLEKIIAIAAGEAFCLAINESHQVYIWGSLTEGLGGLAAEEANETHTDKPRLVTELPSTSGNKPVAIAGCERTAYAKLENGKVYAWGKNKNGECGMGELGGSANKGWKASKSYVIGDKVYDLGVNYKCIVAVSGSTRPGEDATHWQFESHPAQPTPAEVIGVTHSTFIAAGRAHAAATTETGKVFTWGSNEFGQIGNGVSGRENKAADIGTPFEVNIEGKKALSCECGEWNTLVVLEGTETLKTPLIVKLLPEGEFGGEQRARLRVEIHSTLGTTGWTLKHARAPSWWELGEAETLIEELEAILDPENEEGLTPEEKEEYEEELEIAEEALEELENKEAETQSITPTEISSGVLRYDWTPPAPMTKNLSYLVTIKRAASEPTLWREVAIPTASIFGSVYAF